MTEQITDSTSNVEIPGSLRKEKGKGYARKIRSKGLIPANLMSKPHNIMLELDPKWLSKAWKNGKTFDLLLDGQKKAVRIIELQINAVKRSPVHVDLALV